MTTQQGKEQPTYILSYPRPIRLARTGFVFLLMGASLVNWILAWVRFLRPVVLWAGSTTQAIDILAAQPLRPLISAHVSLLLVAGALSFVYLFLPDLALADDGLAVRSMMGWQVIPWTTITTVRIASLEESKRRLVLVQGQWSRRSISFRLVSVCLGGGFEPGLFITSAIRDFGPLMGRIYQEVKKASPEAVFDDEFFALPARLVLEQTPTLEHLVEQVRDEGWPLNLSAQAMASVAGGLVLSQVLMLVLIGGAWWKPAALVALCGLEWIIGALYLYGLTEVFPAQYELQEGLLLYPMPQLPRALSSLPMAMLVAAGLPFLGAMIGLIGVVWAVMLTTLMVQQMYRLESILPATIGAVFQALFQFIMLAIVFTG